MKLHAYPLIVIPIALVIVFCGIFSPVHGQPYGAAGTQLRGTQTAVPVHGEGQRGMGASRGISVSKQNYFWAVAERWDQDWYLPQDRRDPRGFFALSVQQESQDYGWSLNMPQRGAVELDPNGSVSINDVIAAARNLGIPKAIVGTVAFREDQRQRPSIEAKLRVLNVATGRVEGEVRRDLVVSGISNQEGTMDLASAVVPILDRLLHEQPQQLQRSQPLQPSRPSEPPEPPEPPVAAERSAAVRSRGGELTLLIRGDLGYAHWEELQKVLQGQFKSMRINGIELGSDVTVVRIEGVDAQYITSLNGTQIGGGIYVRVGGASQGPNSISLTLTRGAAGSPEQVQ